MSRHRRAAPSISAAAPTAPRWSRNASASAGSFASAATAAPSSVTCATRVPGSRLARGVIDTPGAEASTTYTASVEPLSAGTRMTSATCAHGTNSLTLLGARFDRLRAPIERALHQRHRRPRAAAGDGGQPAVLLRGAAEAVDGHGRQHGRQIRRRARGAPELFLEDGRLHEAEGAAAGVLGQGQAEPAELRHLLPQRLALPARVVPEQTHVRRLHVLVQEGARGVLQELLIGAEGKVHDAS